MRLMLMIIVNIIALTECELLPAPENGNLSGNTVTFGSTVVYSCNNGFDLIGQELRTCLNDEMWSGTTPQCVIKGISVLKHAM